MFVVTGPTGSGKTTTLATMIDYINMNFERHIVTVEDPVEYYHQHNNSVVNPREGHLDVPSFAEALRPVLRQDPDVILVGETRDTETATLMVRAALTGHLVFTTLHTNDAPSAIPRLLDMGVEPFLLPGALVGVLAQRLVRR
ncbi:MAG: GspE/PulE family protein, partial [Phycisphaerales bacterium]